MSKLSFDDSSNLVDIDAPANGEEKENASGETKEKQPDLLLIDDPDGSDIKEHQGSKSVSKKSKAKKLFKRAKSPISGAINKTTKEFKKLSNLPKHHHSSPKSPLKSPSRENLTEEYSKLEQKLGEKNSEEWREFQQMQARVQQIVLKTQTSLNKYTSQSEDEEPRDKQEIQSTRWTGFEEEGGLEAEVIDTSLNPAISITCDNDTESINTIDLLDSKEDSSLIDSSSLIDTSPIELVQTSSFHISNMDNLLDDQPEKTQGSSDTVSQGLVGLDSFMTPEIATDSKSATTDTEGPVLSGYTFSSSAYIEAASSSANIESKPAVDSDILMFEQPLSEFTKNVIPENKTVDQTATESSGEKSEQLATSTASDPTHEPATERELFSLDEDMTDATPVAPLQDGESCTVQPSVPDPVMNLFGEPLQPLKAEAKTNITQDSVVPDDTGDSKEANKPPVTLRATSVSEDFASFDPMKPNSDFMNCSVGASPIAVNISMASGTTDIELFGSSPQAPAMSFGSVPTSNIEHDIFSKIKKMSGSQPVSPAKRRAPEKPKDHFGFVKKELKSGEEDDDDGYKCMAQLQEKNKPVTPNAETVVSEVKSETNQSESVDTSVVKNPFMSESFNENLQESDGKFNVANAAALFGLDSETQPIDMGFDIFMQPESVSPLKSGTIGEWAELETTETVENKIASSSWVDPSTLDTVDIGGDDSTWTDDVGSKEKKQIASAWGGEQGALVETQTDEAVNPFKDDFSKFDEIVVAPNPFLSSDATPSVPVSAASNPFLDLGEGNSPGQADLLSGQPQPTLLSDSESFFFDSVAEPKAEPVADDIFDPFKMSDKGISSEGENSGAAADPLDLFSSVAASGDKQLAKPSNDDDHGLKLDIKPVDMEKPKTGSLPVAPALAPPPKAPKSPQPPRENPFDRESPPEENFAQFEVMDTEKPKEPPPKSMSTESYTSTEEEDETTLEPLEPYLPECEKDTFKLMLRYPTKKKIAGNRYWKNVSVKLEKQKDGLMIRVLNDARDPLPIQELLLQPCYSLSDLTLQQYDQYGKIHTVKLQYVFYKERVGIKTERITPSIVKFKKRSEKPKATMILDHSPQVSELLKFGSLDKEDIMQFIHKLEDVFMNLPAHREKTLTYTKDEVTAEVHDEYFAELDKDGRVLSQKARMRVFVLAFLSGMPIVEVGLNDRRRKGKEVVGRCDIIPIKTEEWIKLQNVEFHGSVDKEDFEKTNNIKFSPLDACKFELMRYRVRLRENKELPLQLTIQQILKNRKCEIRCDLLVTGYHSYSKKHGQFPCEDIEVRFPIPEVWIYMFRYERRFGYGSVHSAARKPGKIKGLERLTMMAQGNMNQALMEADVGTAKYEHVYRSIVWRIPRLPIRNQGAYTSHLFRLKLELGPHDEIPSSFESHTHVSFSMPCSTVSQSQIRSIAVTNPNPPEKWVRSLAKYEYCIEVEHLDEYPELLAIGNVYKEAARPSLKPEEEVEEEEEERDPRLAKSDTDSSDSD